MDEQKRRLTESDPMIACVLGCLGWDEQSFKALRDDDNVATELGDNTKRGLW